jgi:hypothetical protein
MELARRALFVGLFPGRRGRDGSRALKDLPAEPDLFRASETEKLIRLLGDHDPDGVVGPASGSRTRFVGPTSLGTGCSQARFGPQRSSAVNPTTCICGCAAFDRRLEPYTVGTASSFPCS